jgi:hypothetical protein
VYAIVHKLRSPRRMMLGGLIAAALAASCIYPPSGPSSNPPPSGWFTETRNVTVRESDTWVDTGLVIEDDEELTITASGEIWAGVWLTEKNGPEGWKNIDNDPKFPLPGSRPFALIGRLKGRTFYVGAGHHSVMANGPGRLYLRTNDDLPGNGSGQFDAAVTVKRTGVQSWLVLLCKAADVAHEPHTVNYYRNMLSQDGAGTDNVYDYWMSMSSKRLRLNPVIEGWYTITATRADLGARNNAAPVTRDQTAADCIHAAVAGSPAIDVRDFRGVITILNIGTDSGQSNDVVVFGDPGAPVDAAFIEHEMAHVLGLEHSWIMSTNPSGIHVWNGGGDQEYMDCYDLMSHGGCNLFTFTAPPYGPQGPGLCAEFRAQLNWIEPSLIYDAQPGGLTAIQLSAVTRPYTSGYRLARVPAGQAGYYSVEMRQPAGFDKMIQETGILIREVRAGGTAAFLTGGPNWRVWKAGDVFQDTQNGVKIRFDSLSGGDVANLTIDTR